MDIKKHYKKINKIIEEWSNNVVQHRELIIFSLFLLLLSLIINYNAIAYTTRINTSPANDLILDHIPTMDLSLISIIIFFSILALFLIYSVFIEVKKFDEAVSQFSLLLLVRSLFITLTHLEVPLDAVKNRILPELEILLQKNDLFFAAQPAIGFLGFLIFKDRKVKYLFLFLSVVSGITALLMHKHYSIDFLAAYFITYGTYKIGEKLFSVFNNIKENKR